jgi:cyclopropane-fatty-acyl-phospholipid synthase
VFPGGMLPSLARFREEAEKAGLKFAGAFGFGKDYARTLREWLVRMQAAEPRSRPWAMTSNSCATGNSISASAPPPSSVARTDVVQVELVNA